MAKTKSRHHYPLPRFPPADFAGAFRDNIQMFVSQYGELLETNTRGNPTWFTMLADQKSGAGVPLYTVEEHVRSLPDQYCAHCVRTGWRKHFVCKYRYHFVIPAEDEWGDHLDPDHINLPTHLLHGMIHSSGFGHLIQLKWPEVEKKCIPGGILMDLWDRICTSLRTREVSVVDVACWKSMELRLLLGVTRSLPWYGLWGYDKFHKEAFGVTEARYWESAKLLGAIDLGSLTQGGAVGRTEKGRELNRIVNAYCRKNELSGNPREIVTLGDLFHYMLELLELEKKMKPTPLPPSPLPPSAAVVEYSNRKCITEARDFSEVAAKLDRRFPLGSLVNAAEAIAEVLKERTKGQNPGPGSGIMKMTMTRKELRDVAITKVRNTGLLDTVLKNIVNCIVGSHIVRRLYNQSSGVLEYAIEECPTLESAAEAAAAVVYDPTFADLDASMMQDQVEGDLEWVYEHILLKGPYQEAVSVVLTSKQWVKVWPLGTEKNGRLRFLCRWMPNGVLPRPQQPPEVVVVMEPDMAVGELMREAERALRETYCAMEGFRATRLEQVNGKIWVAGVGVDLEREKLTYESEGDEWEMDVACSAWDNSNEDVVECGTWQHKISNGDNITR